MTRIKKDEWDEINYPSLSAEENELIRKARRLGFDKFYPANDSQDSLTLKGAKDFLHYIGIRHKE